MQNSNDCLHAAMFIASESYSGSTYEAAFFRAMDEGCDETIVMPLPAESNMAPMSTMVA